MGNGRVARRWHGSTNPRASYTRQPAAPRATYAYLLEERKMELEKRTDGWWITGVPDAPDCGPYGTKAEADSDRKGMERFFQNEDDRGFFTVERGPSREVTAHATADAAAGCNDAVECVT